MTTETVNEPRSLADGDLDVIGGGVIAAFPDVCMTRLESHKAMALSKASGQPTVSTASGIRYETGQDPDRNH